MDLTQRILELSQYGYFCSQILAILLLETIGEENSQTGAGHGRIKWGRRIFRRCLRLHDRRLLPAVLFYWET